MLSIGLIVFIIWILLNPKINKQVYLFITTLVVTIFWGSSKDRIIGIPLSFYTMLVSLAYSIFKNGFPKKQWPVLFILSTIFIMLIQMINLANGINVMECILLKASNTDTLDIDSQLLIPTLNFTVFKHFVFTVAYMLWAYANVNLLKDNRIYIYIYQIFQKMFKILFVFIIVEFLFVNLTGFNTRTITGPLFNLTMNMKTPWKAWGLFTCVCAWFTEPSYISVVLIYYMMVYTKKDYKFKSVIWILISFAAVFVTGSSTGLVIALIFGTLIFIDNLLIISKRNSLSKVLLLFVVIVGSIVILNNSTMLFQKINIFLESDTSYSSGFFRKQSIEYAWNNFKFSPLIGLGIGTVYCHSGLVQILSNIGILGTLSFIAFHISLLPKCKLRFKTIIKVVIFIGILYASLMIQTLTTPYLLVLIICITPAFETNTCQISKERKSYEYSLCNHQL